jgi:serine/threonine-protein kinase
MAAESDEPKEDNTETVFMPSRAPLAGPASVPTPAPEAAAEPPPEATTPPETPPAGLTSAPVTGGTTGPFTGHTTGPTSTTPPSAMAPGRVSIGDVLNGIYEVKRLIGRGGMGEVYEGVNINSDERVAIKVMLPSLAADAKVQAMFRKEARTLTRLAHPAVVQYRVLAHEPLLNVLYIVTEFVDGVELTAVLGQIHPNSAELKGLMRRLADGLRAAHDLGAVHRDMSPDNVLLPDKRLDRARIIDFGIAKDLDPTKATIVGDGFAGKLAYVAPEQFGDFGREIGPWTDVYSLGLVILAVAQGKDVDMGSTLVEAVDKRRAGVDLSALPDDLRPVLQRMLAADPANRARSMDEVLAMLGEPGHTMPPTGPIEPPRPQTILPTPMQTTTPTPIQSTSAAVASPSKGPPVAALVIGGIVVLALISSAAIYFMWPKPAVKAPTNTVIATQPATTTVQAPAAQALSAGQAINAALPGMSCSWLDVSGAVQTGSPVKLVGASGSPATVQDSVIAAAQGAGVTLPVTSVDLTGVAQADQGACSALDAFRSFKAAAGALTTTAATYTITRGPDGKLTGQPSITLAPHNAAQDFALLRMDPLGRTSVIYANRAAFQAVKPADATITDQGGDSFSVQDDAFNTNGWTGLLLLTGTGPFDADLLTKAPPSRDVSWIDQVRQAATAGGWKASMVWYKVENDAPPIVKAKPKPNPGYYAHPGVPNYETGPIPTAPPVPHPAGRQSVWQRMFGSSGNGGGGGGPNQRFH